MYAIYNGKIFNATMVDGHIRIGCSTQFEGSEEYTDITGNLHTDWFTRVVQQEELECLFNTQYKIKYRGRYFEVSSAINSKTIDLDWFEIQIGLEDRRIASDFGFIQTDKFLWSKEITRKDIESLKVIEIPLGIFASKGTQERILEGQAIDDYLDLILG